MTAPRSEADMAEHATRLGDDTNVIGVGRVRGLESLEERYHSESELDDLKRRMADAFGYFSHIWNQTVTLGVLEDHHEQWGDAVACVAPKNYIVFVDPNRRLSDRTIFHELAHLEIHARSEAGHDVPTSSEEFCDIYAMARMPPESVDTEAFAYLGKPSVPVEEWPGICRRALAYREDHRNYLQKAKEWLGIGGDGQ